MQSIKSLLMVFILIGISIVPAMAIEGIQFDFHGNMLQTVGVTTTSLVLAGKHKSASTDFFSYNGELNIKGFEKVDKYMNLFNSVGTTFGLTKARLRFEAETDNHLAKFVYGLEVGTYNWGDKENKFGLSGDGINQESRFAYAEIKTPQSPIQHTIRMGLQPTDLSDWVWSETAAGLTYHGKNGSLNWMMGWYRGDENAETNSTDNNYLVVKMQNDLSPSINITGYCIYEHAGSETTETNIRNKKHTYDRNNYFIGSRINYQTDQFFTDLEFVYQGGDIQFQNDINDEKFDDLDRNAHLINLNLGFHVNKKLTLTFNSLFVSGDDNPNDKDIDNFDAIDVDVKIGMILFKDSLTSSCDRFVSDAPYLLDYGLIHHALIAEYKPNKDHKFYSAIRFLSTAVDIDIDKNNKHAIGTELDFKYAYKLYKFITLKFEAACLFPDDAADLMTSDGKEAEPILNVVTGIQFKF